MEKKELDKVIELFSINKRRRELWEYLDKYSIKIDEWLSAYSFNQEQLIRFMLIGMFPHYRACVHGSSTFTTDIDKNLRVNLGIRESEKRLFQAFNDVSGITIDSTQHYLKLIKLNDLEKVNGQSLFDFVITGTPIG